MNKKSLRGSLLLLLGSVIWGAAFVAQRVGMDHLGPFSFNGIRMLLAGVVMIPVTAFIERKNARTDRGPNSAGESMDNRRDERQRVDPKDQRLAGLLCGLMLFAASSLQQMGLVTTSAGKAGFITALYVVLVPVAAWLLFKKNPGRIIWLGVALAVFALYLLCMPAGDFFLQSGDLLLLGCAACYTVQILCVDFYAPKVSGVRLARDEFLITGALSMLIALFTETITVEGIREALIPLLYSGIMSGAVGFTLQIIGQRDTDPTIASLLMCLESVFAVLTGAIVLGEKMTVRETAGCILMFSAVILAQLSPVISNLRRGGRSRR